MSCLHEAELPLIRSFEIFMKPVMWGRLLKSRKKIAIPSIVFMEIWVVFPNSHQLRSARQTTRKLLTVIHVIESAQQHFWTKKHLQLTSKIEEGGPPAKRAKQGDGETEALSTSTGAPQKHETSLNISGVTLGHFQALDGEMAKLWEGVDASVAQARTVHGEITKVREGMDANRNEAQAIRGEIAKLTIQLELQNSKLDFQTKMQNQVFAVQNTKPNASELATFQVWF
jgi:hypothetical protein